GSLPSAKGHEASPSDDPVMSIRAVTSLGYLKYGKQFPYSCFRLMKLYQYNICMPDERMQKMVVSIRFPHAVSNRF
ncbi:MAG TPA: hypothetical protein VHO28_04920, partial [Ignavibacteriales bacterium]|nr:hypothetical protein [Ignavibacteriales bacterium]